MIYISLLVLLGLFILGVIIKGPFVGLYFFTVMLYLKPGIFHSALVEAHLTRLVAVITLLVLLFQKKKYGKIAFFDHKLSKWLAVFVLVALCSMITSIWKSNTLQFIQGFLKIILGYFLIINLSTDIKKCRYLIWAMIFSMLYIIVFSLKEYIGYGRLFGAFRGALFGDPNDLAMGLIVLIPFLFFGMFRKKNLFFKGIDLGIMGLFLYVIILTQSRGGLVGMCAMLLALWWKSKKKVLGVIMVVIFLIVGWHVAPTEYKERMMTISTAYEEDNAAISRVDAWKAGFNMMKSRFFGVGLGNFGEGFVQYRPEGAVDAPGMRRVSHNMFIQVGGETGVPGLMVFLLLISATFSTLGKVQKRLKAEESLEQREIVLFTRALVVSLFSYCAAGMFLTQAFNWVLYYFIAFAVLLDGFSLKLEKNES